MQTWVIVLLWLGFFLLGGVAAWSNWKRGKAGRKVNRLINDIKNRSMNEDMILNSLEEIRKDLGHRQLTKKSSSREGSGGSR